MFPPTPRFCTTDPASCILCNRTPRRRRLFLAPHGSTACCGACRAAECRRLGGWGVHPRWHRGQRVARKRGGGCRCCARARGRWCLNPRYLHVHVQVGACLFVCLQAEWTMWIWMLLLDLHLLLRHPTHYLPRNTISPLFQIPFVPVGPEERCRAV
jgi:hypothetical protein